MDCMKSIQNIFFDLDGTIVNSKPGIDRSIRYAMAELNRPLDDDTSLDWCIGPPIHDAFATLINTTDKKLIDQGLRYYRKRYAELGIFECTLYPDIETTLSSLQEQNYQLYLATSKPRIYAEEILQHHQLNHYFTDINGSELDGTRADKQELIEYILDKNQLDPQQTLMIGDRKFDINGAKQNKVSSLAVSYGFGSMDELKQAKPDYICETAAGILTMISDHALVA